AAVIYQGGLRTRAELNGLECEIVGEPDFLIYETGNYVIRDSKMSRRVIKKDHPEIFGQLQIYGWLYEQVFGRPPCRVEIHSGTGAIVEIPYDGPTTARQLLEEIVSIKQLSKEP